jgi:hypothetical protein
MDEHCLDGRKMCNKEGGDKFMMPDIIRLKCPMPEKKNNFKISIQ